jgi:hypothetical protein
MISNAYRLTLTIGLIMSAAPARATNEHSYRQQYAVGEANDKTIQAAQAEDARPDHIRLLVGRVDSVA